MEPQTMQRCAADSGLGAVEGQEVISPDFQTIVVFWITFRLLFEAG